MGTAEVLTGRFLTTEALGKRAPELNSCPRQTEPDLAAAPPGLALGARLPAAFSSPSALAPMAVLVLPTARHAGESSR